MRRSENEYQSWDMTELATLPPGHPGRPELERRLSAMSEGDLRHWTAVIAEAEELRDRLDADIPVPATLVAMLASIPDTIAPESRLKLALREPVGWRHLAAVLVVGLGIATYAFWPAPRPKYPEPLGEPLVARLTELAIAAHLHPAPLELASDDREKVQKALSAHELPFAPAVLESNASDTKLRGETTMQFAGTVAAVTRWDHKGTTWSLFQFSPRTMDVPGSFIPISRDVGEGDQRRRVFLWPGADGSCTWALVADASGAEDVSNPFPAGYGYCP